MFEILVNNADPSMSDQEIDTLYEQYEEACEAELDALADRVKNGESKEAVIADIMEGCKNKTIAEFIVKRLSQKLRPFEDTRFLRAMEFTDFKKKMTYIFENAIFRCETKDTINKYLGLEEEQIERMIKLANTIMHYYMIKRYTQNSFSLALRDGFSFHKIWIEYLWNFCKENEECMKTVITMRCYSLLLKTENSINNVYRIFSSMLDEDDDDDLP